MDAIHIVLSTEPKGGKGGVATVIPLYLELLRGMGTAIFIPTHRSTPFWGKFAPWILSFFSCARVTFGHRAERKIFHVHPGSGFCLLRMLTLTAFLRLFLRQSVLVYLHTPYLERYLREGFWRWVIASLIRLSSRTVALTSYAKNLLEQERLADKVSVIPNPFRSQKKEIVQKEKDICRVLVMGRIVHGKGFIETLRAFERLPARFNLIVAGDGPLLDELRTEAHNSGLNERVEWAGWVSGEDKHRLLQRSHVFCLPSRVDSFGMSFVEAQCYDLPIVALRHPPVMEVIRSEQSVIVNDLDSSTLAKAIKDAETLSKLSVPGDGCDWVEERFGFPRIHELVARMVAENFL